MNMQRLTALALALPLLASCALLTNQREDIVVYSLRAVSTQVQADATTPRAWQLALTEPQAIAPLDGMRIVVMPKPGEIEFYHGARWRDAVPTMLQALLLQAHENRVHVAAPGEGVRADFSLRTRLRDFQAEYRAGERAPIIVIGLAAQFISAADGRVVASRTFAIEQAAAGTAVADVVAAFESASSGLCADLAQWSLAQGDATWSASLRR